MARLSGSLRRGDARAAIAQTLADLAITRRYQDIRIGDLIERSGVGRSTFYDHFRSKDDVLLAVIDPVLTYLANAACNRLSRAAAISLFRHFWDRRTPLRHLLGAPVAMRIERDLTDRIGQRRHWSRPADGHQVLHAAGIAAAQLAMIRSWLSGQTALPAEAAVDQFLTISAHGFGTATPSCPA